MRLVLATYGSGGDLFPFVPVARTLIDDGHDVLLVTPRSLRLAVASARLPVAPFGIGTELGFARDWSLLTTRFDGWASWRVAYNRYVGARLEEDVADIGRVFDAWRPDLVVAATFASAARVAAHLASIPLVDASIYRFDLGGGTAFARSLQAQIAAMIGFGSSDLTARLAFGAPAAVLLDPAFEDIEEACGYPYWDDVVLSDHATDEVDEWLSRSSQPVVALTLGSFLGQYGDPFEELRRDPRFTEYRFLTLGRSSNSAVAHAPSSRDLSVNYMPLRRLRGRLAAIVHHGGIGTLMGAVGTGIPSVVLAQAFDQPANARLAERHNVGVGASTRTVADGLHFVLTESQVHLAVQRWERELVPCDVAARRASAAILAAHAKA